MNVAMNDAATMLGVLQRWRDAGWLRALDLALARFIHSLDPEAKPLLLLATALLAQLESAGHTCLRLDVLLGKELVSDLAWPMEAVRELNDVLDGVLVNGVSGEMSSPCVGHAEAGSTPLVLDGPRLYLRRYWMDEQAIAKSLLQRVRTLPQVQANAHRNAHQAQAVLQTLFDPTDAVDWQQVACGLALRRGLTLLTGGPGTGKTYTAARLLVLLQSLAEQPLRVALAAPTGKAAARLHQSIESALVKLSGPAVRHLTEHLRPAQTLHSLLGVQPDSRRFVHDASQPLDVDVLIIDEASMVHLELMARVLEALPLTARLILLGDKDQLASVEAGSVLGDLCDHVPDRPYAPETCAWVQAATGQILPPQVRAGPTDTVSDLAQQVVMLRTSQRFGGAIAALAQAVNAGDAMTALALLHAAGPKEFGDSSDAGGPLALQQPQHAHALGELALHGRAGAAGGYRSFLSLLKAGVGHEGVEDRQAWIRQLLRSFEGFRVLSALREGPWGVAGLNKVIEQALAHAGLIRPGSLGGGWYEGRPVMVTRNDPALGVFNGDVGIALRNPRGSGTDVDAMLRVWFLDGEQLRSVAASRLAAVETAWAMTVHKSQGSEFSHTALVLPDHSSAVLTRELVYTGLTRARRAFTLIAPNPEVFAQALQRRTRRASGLKAVLAQNVDCGGRGLNPPADLGSCAGGT